MATKRPTRAQVTDLEQDIICLKREKSQLEDNNATLREMRRQIETGQKGLTGIRQRAMQLVGELQVNLVHERTFLLGLGLGLELDEDRSEPDPAAVRDVARDMVMGGNQYREPEPPPRVPVEVLVGRLLECLSLMGHDYVDQEELRRLKRGW